jgi:hypothetical protein
VGQYISSIDIESLGSILLVYKLISNDHENIAILERKKKKISSFLVFPPKKLYFQNDYQSHIII